MQGYASDNESESMNYNAGLMDDEQDVLAKRYHGIEKIGHGAQATMLKALDAWNRPVAIKVFDCGSANGWKDYDLFEREIELLKNLHVDGVPRYIETIKTDRKLFLVEEYIDAMSLEKQMKAGRRFTAGECGTILKNAAKILQKLSNHFPPIIHRDIKPANLLVDEDLNVYLVDFGVVAKTNQTLSTTFAGTAGYVSPEQIYGKTTPASDIYSLGATMLHLITHVAPCDMQLNGISPDFDKYIPKSVPPWLSKTIKKMMSIDPAQRPQSGDELIAWMDHVKYESPLSENHGYERTHDLANINDDMTIIRSLMKRYSFFNKCGWIWFAVGLVLMILTVVVFAVLEHKVNEYTVGFVVGSGVFLSFFSLIVALVYLGKSSGLLSLPGLMDSIETRGLVRKALNGDAYSQYFIGRKYESGDGAIQSEQSALAWYALSAEKGCAQARAKVDEMQRSVTPQPLQGHDAKSLSAFWANRSGRA